MDTSNCMKRSRALNFTLILAVACFIATVGVMYVNTILAGSLAPWLPAGAIVVAAAPIVISAINGNGLALGAFIVAAIVIASSIWGTQDGWLMAQGLVMMLTGFGLAIAASMIVIFIRNLIWKKGAENWVEIVFACYMFAMAAINLCSLESQSLIPRILAAEGRLAIVLAVLAIAWQIVFRRRLLRG